MTRAVARVKILVKSFTGGPINTLINRGFLVILWLMTLMIFVNHDVTNDFLLSLTKLFCYFLLTPPKSSSSPTILTFLKFLCSAVIKGNTFPVVYQDSEDVGPENAPNEVPENVVLGNAPNFVPDNVVFENAETAGNVVANAGQV